MIERHTEPFGDLILHRPHFRAVFLNRFTRFGRCQFRRRAMLIGGTEKQHLMAARTLETGVKIRRQLAAHKIAEVLDPVDIRDRGGDEMPSHAESSCVGVTYQYPHTAGSSNCHSAWLTRSA